ncbi:unnamed protein product [Clonostachys chloroleuca]|uniref:Heterokaryon incompatibility domain-containing protein n=1 Tax=Clonostachys chloroleuca TaxID=1926264 RepID=A0AA35LRG8_9HYPO|nr:unnamed protein product [Clonostachys chloroleuca]
MADKKSRLCHACASIDPYKPCHGPEYRPRGASYSTHLFYPHHASVADLQISAERYKCQLCVLILNSVSNHKPEDVAEEDEWDFVLDEAGSEKSAEGNVPGAIIEAHSTIFGNKHSPAIRPDDVDSPLVLELVFRECDRSELESRCSDFIVHWTSSGEDGDGLTRQKTTGLCLVSGLEDDLTHFYESHDGLADQHTGSVPALDLAKVWFQSCESSHEQCQKARDIRTRYLPTRVLNVSDEEHIFVHVPGRKQRDEYVSLSHCWGVGKQFKLETGSLKSRQTNINLHEMPKTFQDAVRITRHIGLRYLWIDSLCIIQDSEKDWLQEAARMGQYYRDASFTIFAAAADGDDKGCFWDRDGRIAAPSRTAIFDKLLPIMKPGSENSCAFIQKISHHWGRTPMPAQYHFLDTVRTLDERPNPLNKRGWTLQEWVLSSRGLIFDEWEVRWSCPTTEACECIPEGRERQQLPAWYGFADQASGGNDAANKEQGNQTSRLLSLSWNQMIRRFSTRKLTYPKDKLPALAGVATELLNESMGSYLAGLWQHNLRRDLAWWVPAVTLSTSPDVTRRAASYRAPSWSWASVDGELRTTTIYRVSEETTLRGLTKQARDSECQIVKCETIPLSSLNPLGAVASGVLVLRGHMRCADMLSPSIHHGFNTITIIDPETEEELGQFLPDDTSAPPRYTKIWCVLLYTGSDLDITCLALVRAADEERVVAQQHISIPGDAFCRVGIVRLKWRDPAMGEAVGNRYTYDGGAVNYEANEDLCTLAVLLAWLKRGTEQDICII